ncbi:MAG TPA: CPBP family intramembrane glutamic endopeptidase [Actinomycetota bacterium]|nr:CPBP family intramembrane glutamic endopeptidase [Actinomycetota bacterium]
MVLLSFAWSSIPGLRSLDSSGSGSSYEAGTVTAAILAFELIVRYPVTVAVEEAFFRGFLLPRITVAAPVVTGVLFGLYHLQQWRTIPSIIPFGIALGLLRWWLGSIWPGAALHYVGNALFILALYRP